MRAFPSPGMLSLIHPKASQNLRNFLRLPEGGTQQPKCGHADSPTVGFTSPGSPEVASGGLCDKFASSMCIFHQQNHGNVHQRTDFFFKPPGFDA